MRTFAAGVLQRGPRRSQLSNAARPYRRGELAGGLAAIALIAELLLLPVAVPVSLVLLAVGRGSRWRPEWLLLPLLAGVGWMAAAGPGGAVTTMAAGRRQVLSGLIRAASDPSRLLRDPGGAAAAALALLPRELPAALVAGAVQAGLLTWFLLRRRQQSWRPGVVAAAREWRVRASLAAGQTVTAAGCAIGLDARTGRVAGFSWADAERGVLLTGTDPGELAAIALAAVCAAMRRRKTVLVVDFDSGRDSAGLTGAVALLAGSLGLPVSRVSRPDGPVPTAVSHAIRARGVLLVSGSVSGARLCGEVAGALAWLRARGLRGDSLLCLSACEAVDPAVLTDLLALGPSTGTAMLASTTSAACAEALAGHVSLMVACGAVSQELATRLIPARIAADGGISLGADALLRQRPGEFTVMGPQRVRPGCRAVPIMAPGEPSRAWPGRGWPTADVPTAAGSR
jgi:hypothetical protein